MAGAGLSRLCPILRSPNQLPSGKQLPRRTGEMLLPRPPTTQRKAVHYVAEDEPSGATLDTCLPNLSPLAQRALRRQTLKVGARCGNSARRDLCGGLGVTCVPTATAPDALFVQLNPFPCDVFKSRLRQYTRGRVEGHGSNRNRRWPV